MFFVLLLGLEEFFFSFHISLYCNSFGVNLYKQMFPTDFHSYKSLTEKEMIFLP